MTSTPEPGDRPAPRPESDETSNNAAMSDMTDAATGTHAPTEAADADETADASAPTEAADAPAATEAASVIDDVDDAAAGHDGATRIEGAQNVADDAEAAHTGVPGPPTFDPAAAPTPPWGGEQTPPWGAPQTSPWGAAQAPPWPGQGPPAAGQAPPWGGGQAPPWSGQVPPPSGPAWSGQTPPPPPPGTSGYATRFGLVRPVQNRYIAGVCGAFARATNTDPVLWRVALPVLTVLGGFGIIIYLLGWLLIPAEGDTGSPAESLIGRGWSGTSKWLTVVLGLIAITWVATTFSTGFGWKIVIAALVVGGLFVLGGSRGAGRGQPVGSRPGQQVGPQPGQPQGQPQPGQSQPGQSHPDQQPGYPPGPQPGQVAPSWTATTGTGWPGPPAATGAMPGAPAAMQGVATADPGTPPASAPVDTPGWEPPTYRPPFAPGGPYAAGSPYVPGSPYAGDPYAPGGPFGPGATPYDDPIYSLDFPGLTTTDPMGTGPSEPVSAPADRRRSTVARRVTLFATAFAVGLLGILDAANAISVSAPAYFALALAVVGLGLIVGSMFGRVRGPIVLGILLTIGLIATSVTSTYHAKTVTLRPTSVAEIPTNYTGQVQRLTIDLRNVDFAKQNETIRLRLTAGMILVELPPNVNAQVHASVGAGATRLFGQSDHGGLHVRSNAGFQALPGSNTGNITIDANISFAGLVEVTR